VGHFFFFFYDSLGSGAPRRACSSLSFPLTFPLFAVSSFGLLHSEVLFFLLEHSLVAPVKCSSVLCKRFFPYFPPLPRGPIFLSFFFFWFSSHPGKLDPTILSPGSFLVSFPIAWSSPLRCYVLSHRLCLSPTFSDTMFLFPLFYFVFFSRLSPLPDPGPPFFSRTWQRCPRSHPFPLKQINDTPQVGPVFLLLGSLKVGWLIPLFFRLHRALKECT